ncbi:MAG: sulfurtransferase TusA family protein [Nitrosomonadales bacterium]|nr:sulfurtransferase TusA family protein [Nitrosomonadales bacterium]
MHTANITLDMKGTTCPGPLLGAKRMVDDLDAGQILLLISDCPGTRDDLYAWAKQTGNAVLQAEKLAAGGTGYYIQKGQGTARKANVTLDMRGVVCPGPIVEAKKLLNGMQSGEVLKLISNCPGTQADITGWAAATGMEIAATVVIAPGEFEFYIRKH